MLKNLVESFLTFHQSVFPVFRSVEKIYYQYAGNKSPKYLREYSTLARKYYHILNLFFWWASGTGMQNCSRVITSKIFESFSGKLRKLNLATTNYFSTYCVYAKAALYWKEVTVLEKKRKGYVEFIIDHIQTYSVISLENFLIPLEPKAENRTRFPSCSSSASESRHREV